MKVGADPFGAWHATVVSIREMLRVTAAHI